MGNHLITKNDQKPIPYLFKHSAAVHIDKSLSLLERKIFNILLKNAFSNLQKKSEHKLKISELSYQIGWESSSKQNAELKKALIDLNGTQVQWNIFNKDKRNSWGVASLISGAEITNGIITYRFDEKVRTLLASPSLYARLNLDVHQKFKSKYAYILWEFFVEILGARNTNNIEDYAVLLSDLRRYLVITDKYIEFKDLNRAILAPAIKEINKVSDIEVSFEVERLARKVDKLIFTINKKKEFQRELDYSQERRLLIIAQKINSIGISDVTHKQNLKKFGIDKIEKALLILESEMLDKEIKNPRAYFTKALEGDWEAKTPKNIIDVEGNEEFIENYLASILSKEWKEIMKWAYKKYGSNILKNWLCKLDYLENKNGKVIIEAKTRFIKEYVEQHYLSALLDYWKSIDNHIKDIIIVTSTKIKEK